MKQKQSERNICLKPKAEYLLLAGDIGYPETQIYQDFMKQCSQKFKKVFYTSGNHEYYQHECTKTMEEIETIIKDTCQKYDNIYFLQNDSYDFDDLKIVGSTLWSDVEINEMEESKNINDYSCIYTSKNMKLSVSDTIQMYNKNKEYIESVIKSSTKPVLVMTHYLPSYKMILPCYDTYVGKSYFASDLEYLFQEPLVAWVCGHSHGFNRILINHIPCIINGIGYPSEARRGSSLDYVFQCM